VNESSCRICKSRSLYLVHSFFPTPYGDLYKKDRLEALGIAAEDLSLLRCNVCGLLQLRELTRLNEQYSEYLYLTSVTNKLVPFYGGVVRHLVSFLNLQDSDHVLDIGSNDGSFLECFASVTSNLHGVDPSVPACKIATEKGLEISNAFFDLDFSRDYADQKPKPRLITCNYTIANVPDLDEFFVSVRQIMSSQTLFNVITGYHLDQFQIGMFDYVNHDHHTYLTLHDFNYLANRNEMKVVYFRKHEHKGGSIEVGLALKTNPIQVEDSVPQNLQRESWLESKTDGLIFNMIERNARNSRVINTIAQAYLDDDYRVVGVGASISSTTLISEFRLAGKISTIYDDDALKHNTFSPGTGICVKPLAEISHLKTKTVALILGWQHSTRLIERLQELKYKGFILVPMPIPRLFHMSN
jgi:hypothetical protein